MGLFGGSSVIGLSEEKVNDTLNTFNTDSQNVLEELTNKLNKVLAEIADNWGTADAVSYTTDTLVPSFNELEKKVAQIIKQIGDTIRTTGIQQAADTKNNINPIMAQEAQVGSLVNNVKDKLDNGFIGVYNTLKTDVGKAQQNLIDDVLKKLDKLKSNAVNNCSKAFTDAGTSKVADACDGYIEEVKTAIKSSFDSVSESINELTASAEQFAKDIQAAGLRGSAGTE